MQFVEDIKQKVGDFFFKKELKSNPRQREVHNLHTAQSIGILYDATEKEDMLKVSEFVNTLFQTKKDVKALGFVNLKELSHHHMPMLQFDFFFLKSLFQEFQYVHQQLIYFLILQSFRQCNLIIHFVVIPFCIIIMH